MGNATTPASEPDTTHNGLNLDLDRYRAIRQYVGDDPGALRGEVVQAYIESEVLPALGA